LKTPILERHVEKLTENIDIDESILSENLGFSGLLLA